MLYNAQAYERPASIEEARQLLQRADLKTLALYDDLSTVDPDRRAQVEAAVDLGGLGLSGIDVEGTSLRIGATASLQTIVDELPDAASGLLATCAHQTAGWHVRRAATIGGLLTGGSISAPARLALDALDAQIEITGQDEPILLTNLVLENLAGEIILAVILDLPKGAVGTAYEQVGRTPKDLPIVNAAAVVRSTGGDSASAQISVGGVLTDNLLRLTLDRAELTAVDGLIDDLGGPLLDDHLGSAEYRREMARVLSHRVLTDALSQVGMSAS